VWETKPVLAVWRKAKTLASTGNQTTSPPSSSKQPIQYLVQKWSSNFYNDLQHYIQSTSSPGIFAQPEKKHTAQFVIVVQQDVMALGCLSGTK
jgi:hypothetical protein